MSYNPGDLWGQGFHTTEMASVAVNSRLQIALGYCDELLGSVVSGSVYKNSVERASEKQTRDAVDGAIAVGTYMSVQGRLSKMSEMVMHASGVNCKTWPAS